MANTELSLKKNERDILSVKASLSLRKLFTIVKSIICPIKPAECQRDRKNRINDRKGFLATYFRTAELISVKASMSDTMKRSLQVLGISPSKAVIAPLTNTNIFLTNTNKIFDGQNRFYWLAGFFTDQYTIPEEILNEDYVGLTFSQLKEVNPDLAETLLDLEIEITMLDTSDPNIIAKYFCNINNGAKRVSAKEVVMALYCCSTSKDFYKKMETINSEIDFRGREVAFDFYSRTPKDMFVRSICYMNNLATTNPNETIGIFLDKMDGKTEEDYWKLMRIYASIYNELNDCKFLRDLVSEYKGHTPFILTKLLFRIAKEKVSKTFNPNEEICDLSFEDIKIAGKIVRKHQKVIANTINEIVFGGTKIDSSVKDINISNNILNTIITKNPSLGLLEEEAN